MSDTLCDMSDAIDAILPLEPKSSSPTDVWLVRFKDDTFINDKPVRNVVVKLFINPNSVRKGELSSDDREKLCGLQYEAEVYRKIIDPLSDICPHFIRFVGTSTCSAAGLINLIKSKTDISKEDVEFNFFTNVLYMCNQVQTRLSVIDSPRESDLSYYKKVLQEVKNVTSVNKSWSYCMTMTELAPKPMKSLDMYLRSNESLVVQSISQGIPDPILVHCLFQVAVAAFAYTSAGLAHNDLHAGNVFLGITPIETVRYNIFPSKTAFPLNTYKSYTFDTSVQACIYDWDRSFVKTFGNNALIEGYYCEKHYQCNLSSGLTVDMLRFFQSIWSYLNAPKEAISFFCSLLSKQKKFVKKVEKTFKTDLTPESVQDVENMLCSYPELINRLSRFIAKSSEEPESVITVDEDEISSTLGSIKIDQRQISACNLGYKYSNKKEARVHWAGGPKKAVSWYQYFFGRK